MEITDNSPLDAGVAQHMRDFCSTLSEMDRRPFEAIEARQADRPARILRGPELVQSRSVRQLERLQTKLHVPNEGPPGSPCYLSCFTL
jgi:hypothetical protein